MAAQPPFGHTFKGAWIDLRLAFYPSGPKSPNPWGAATVPGGHYEQHVASEEEAVTWFRSLWKQGVENSKEALGQRIQQFVGKQRHTVDGVPFTIESVPQTTVNLSLSSGALVSVSGTWLLKAHSLGLPPEEVTPSRIKRELGQDVPGAAYISAILRALSAPDAAALAHDVQ